MELISSIQRLVIGVIFIWSGSWKVFIPGSLETAYSSALSVFIKNRIVLQILFRSLGTTETLIGILLIIPPVFLWENYASSVFALGFIIYLFVSYKIAPNKPCGCIGSRGKQISWRTLCRAIYLWILSIIGWYSNIFWYPTLKLNYWLFLIIMLEGGIFVALSSEIDWLWIDILNFPLFRKLLLIFNRNIDCGNIQTSLPNMILSLKRSIVFKACSDIIQSELVEHWRDGCWYFLCYQAKYQDRKVLIVFSVPIQDNINAIRAAIVDDKDNSILLQVDPLDIESINLLPQRF
jgi:hypothetical protein